MAYTTISFPNGSTPASGTSNSENINGSPSDVDVRTALTLYNRIKKRCLELLLTVETNPPADGEKKKKEKYLSQKVIEFDIVSDLGTSRRIVDVTSLAHLLSIEMEQELLATNDSITNHHSFQHINPDAFDTNQTPSDTPNKLKFYNIQPSKSGIIHLISIQRSQQLYSAGRVPCTHCTKWCKGRKGLWWHQLKEHGVDYGNAMEVAVGSVNELALVKFGDDEVNSLGVLSGGVDSLMESSSQENKNSCESRDNDVFTFVKNGDLDAIVRQVEVSSTKSMHIPPCIPLSIT